MVEYSSFTLLSKVMEGHGDTHLLDGDFTMAEEAFQEAIAFKRKSLNIIRTEDVVAKVFNNKIQINLELGKLLIGTSLLSKLDTITKNVVITLFNT